MSWPTSCPMDHGPHLVRFGAPVGHMVPGSHEGPGGSEGAFREVLGDVLADVPQQPRVGALAVEDVPTLHVVHICPEGSHEGAAVRQREGVGGVLSDGLIKGDHPIVVHLEVTPGAGGCNTLTWVLGSSRWTLQTCLEPLPTGTTNTDQHPKITAHRTSPRPTNHRNPHPQDLQHLKNPSRSINLPRPTTPRTPQTPQIPVRLTHEGPSQNPPSM